MNFFWVMRVGFEGVVEVKLGCECSGLINCVEMIFEMVENILG